MLYEVITDKAPSGALGHGRCSSPTCEVVDLNIKLTELPYQRDSSLLFSKIAHESWSIFLDSGYPNIDLGRYDILVARPRNNFV